MGLCRAGALLWNARNPPRISGRSLYSLNRCDQSSDRLGSGAYSSRDGASPWHPVACRRLQFVHYGL